LVRAADRSTSVSICSPSGPEPSEAVGRVKAGRIRTLALRWLEAHPDLRGGELRFDVVSVVRRRGCAPELEHLRAAF
jgi:putative endonuclease